PIHVIAESIVWRDTKSRIQVCENDVVSENVGWNERQGQEKNPKSKLHTTPPCLLRAQKWINVNHGIPQPGTCQGGDTSGKRSSREHASGCLIAFLLVVETECVWR